MLLALRSLDIGKRLTLLSGILLCLLALTGLMGVRALISADADMRRVYEQNTVPLVIVGEALSHLYQARTLVVSGLGAESSDAADGYFKQVAPASEQLTKQLTDYAAALTRETDRGQAVAVHALAKQYLASSDKVISLAKSGDFEAATSLMRGDSDKIFRSSRDALLASMVRERDNALSSFNQNTASNRSTRTGMVVLLVLGLLLGAGLSYAIATSISRPLRQAVVIAAGVADGDLTQTITSTSSDEVGQLLSALGRMNASLVGIVTTLKSSADEVLLGSGEIASGNLNLSIRTESQASQLQEAAASMEELSTTVRQNADNARQANQLASGACEVAVRGGDVVGQVVATMKGINDSSKQIADITSVIDGIAFQTNILALNAAVEAARAGEQGRGFAVVASEVRMLAQRSAAAAKEIKSLIATSVERVHQGTNLVDQAGGTMSEVVSAIRHVAGIVGDISSASTGQNAGVARVCEAVTLMDQSTQQNAALVEQSAAAAESLKRQAQQLVQAVSAFKLQSP
ncbi:methyl-accepting chemotaxis protein [Pelomonas sp. HMWF004]|nr:methyl-accepting chemotaxis protein [Pelomonas sp. HMWF004]